MAQNDWIATLMYNQPSSLEEVVANGLTPDNVNIKSEDYYKGLDEVQKAFSKDGKFDENAFNNFYVSAVNMYNKFAEQDWTNKLVDGLDKDEFDWTQPLKTNVKDKSVILTPKSYNPERRSMGITGIGKMGDPIFSIREIAQDNYVRDVDGTKLDWTPNQHAGLFRSIVDPTLALAVYDEDGTHEQNGVQVKHRKGDYKVDENGDFYYEKLGAKESYGRDVLRWTDTLTVDGSTLNKFDFMDSDGLDKSITSTILKASAQLAPFLIPGVNTVAGAIGAFVGLASVAPTLTKAINNITISADTSGLTKAENFFAKFAPTQSDKGRQAGIISVEGIADVLSSSASQLYSQKVLGRLTYALGRGLGATENAAELGRKLSLGYMAITSSKDVYSDFKAAGASDAAAGIGMLATIGATYGLMNTDYFREWLFKGTVLDESETIDVLNNLRKDAFKNGQIFVGDQIINTADKEANKALYNKVANAITKAWTKLESSPLTGRAAKTTASGLEKARGTIGNYIARGLNEGIEETMEEGTADMVKALFAGANALGIPVKDKNVQELNFGFTPDDIVSRYGQAFLGGFMGGAVFEGLNQYENLFGPPMVKLADKTSQEQILYMLATGKEAELKDRLKVLYQKGKLGNSNLSATEVVTTKDGQKYYKQGTEDNNQNLYMYKAMSAYIDYMANIINNFGLNLMYEDSFIDIEKRLLAGQKLEKGKFWSDNEQEVIDFKSLTGLGEAEFLEYKKTNPLIETIKNFKLETSYISDLVGIASEIVDLESKIADAVKNTPAKTDEQKQQVAENNKKTVSIKEMQQRLKELKERRDNLILGKNDDVYAHQALFITSKDIHKPYVGLLTGDQKATSKEFYAERIYGKNYKALNETQKQIVDQQFALDSKDEIDNRKKAAAIHYTLMENLSPELARVDKVLQPLGPNHYYDHNRILKNSESYRVYTENLAKRWDLANEITQLQTELNKIEKAELQNLINSDDYFVDLRGRDLNALDDDTLYLKEEAEAKLIDFITDEDYKAKRAQLNIDQQEMIDLDKKIKNFELYMDGHKNLLQENTTQAGIAELTVPIVNAYTHIKELNKAIEEFDLNNKTIAGFLKNPDSGEDEEQALLNFQNSLSELLGEEVIITNDSKANEIWKEKLQKVLEENRFKPFDALVQYYKNLKTNQIVSDNDILLKRTLKEFIAPIVNVNTFASVWEDTFDEEFSLPGLSENQLEELKNDTEFRSAIYSYLNDIANGNLSATPEAIQNALKKYTDNVNAAQSVITDLLEGLDLIKFMNQIMELKKDIVPMETINMLRNFGLEVGEDVITVMELLKSEENRLVNKNDIDQYIINNPVYDAALRKIVGTDEKPGIIETFNALVSPLMNGYSREINKFRRLAGKEELIEEISDNTREIISSDLSFIAQKAEALLSLSDEHKSRLSSFHVNSEMKNKSEMIQGLFRASDDGESIAEKLNKGILIGDTKFKIDLKALWDEACEGVVFDNVTKQNMPAFNKAFFTFADSVYDEFHKANLSNEDIGKVIAQGLDKDGYKLNVGKYSQDSEYIIPNLGNIDYLLIIGTTKLSNTYKVLREVYAANEGIVPLFSQIWTILGNEAYLNGTEAFNYVNDCIHDNIQYVDDSELKGDYGDDTSIDYIKHLSKISNVRFVQGGPGTGKTSVIDNLTKQLHDKLHPNVNYIAVAPHQIQVDNLKSLLKIKEDQCYTLDELFKIILDEDPKLSTDAYHGAQYKQESIKFNKDIVSKLKLNKNTVFIIDEGTFISEGKLQVLSKLGDIFGIKCIMSGDRKQNGEFALDPNGKTYSSTGVEDCVLSTAMELTSTIRAENVAQLNNVEALGEKVDRGFRFYLKNRGTSSEKISKNEKILGGDPVELTYSEGDDFFVGTKIIGSITDAKAYVNKFKKLAGDKTILVISDHKDDYKDLQGNKQILVLDAHAAQGGEFDYVIVDKRFDGYRYDQFRDINTILSRAKIGSVIVNKPELKNLIHTDGPKDKSLATEPTTISSSADQLTTWEKQNHDFLGEVKTPKPEKEEKPKKDDGKTNPDGLTETQVQILDVLSSDFEDEGTQDEVITTVVADQINGSDDYKTEADEEIEEKVQEERTKAKDVKKGQVSQARTNALHQKNVVTAETLLADNKTFIDEIFSDKSELFKRESDESNKMSIFHDMPSEIDYKKFINYFSSAVIANIEIKDRHVAKIHNNTGIDEEYIRKITDYWNSIADQDRVFYVAPLDTPGRSVLYLPVIIDGKQKLIPISTIESEVSGIIKVPKGNLLFSIASTVKAIKTDSDEITSIDSLPYGAVYSKTKILSIKELTGEVGDGTGAYSVARNNQFAYGDPKGKTRGKKGANGNSFTVYSPIAILTDEDFEQVFKFRKVNGKNTYFTDTDVEMDATVVSTDGSGNLGHKEEISYLRGQGHLGTKADGTIGDELKLPVQLVGVQRVASLAQLYDVACIVKYANGNIPYEKLSKKQQSLIGENNRVAALNYIQSILGEFSLDLGESSDTDEQNEISRSNFAKLRDKYRLMTKGASSNLLNALYLTFTDSSVQNGELQTKFEENLFRVIQTKAKAKSGYGNISQTGLEITFADGGSAKKRYFVYYDSEDSCYKIKAGTSEDSFDESKTINIVESKGWHFGKQMDITFAQIIEAINNAEGDPNAGYHWKFTTENLKWKPKNKKQKGYCPITFELKTRVEKNGSVGYYTPSDYDYIFNSFRGMSISDFKALEKVFREVGYFKKGIILNDVGSTLEEGNCWKDLKVSSETQNERTSNIVQYNPPVYKLNFEVIPGTIDDLYNELNNEEIKTRVESNDEKISEFKKKVVSLLNNTIDDLDIDEALIFPENFDSIYKDDGKESAIEAMQELLILNYHVKYDTDLNAMVPVNNNEDTDQEILNKILDMGFDINSLQDLTNIKDDRGNVTQVTFTYNKKPQVFFIKEYNGQKELISANLNEIIDSLDLVVDGINDVKRAEIFNHLETIILSVSSKGINEVIKDIRTFFLDNKHILSTNGQAALRSIINKFIAGRGDNSIQTSCGLKHGL